MNSVIYDLQFAFRQKYSTSHDLIHLTGKIREQLDNGNFVWSNIWWSPKSFSHSGWWHSCPKIESLGIRGVANNWFSPYLHNWSKYVSTNGFNSKLEHIHCGVLQGSMLEPLLFLII